MQKVQTTILKRTLLPGDYYDLELGNPFRDPVLPGHFVMLSAHGLSDPYLKRPYSVCRARPASLEHPEGIIRLLIKIVGKGSRQMAELPVGTAVEMVGPLGQPFTVPDNISRAVFVAGGIGVAPFVELAAYQSLRSVKKIALIGGRSSADVLAADDLESLGVDVRLATEDGSLGIKGFVTLLLKDILDEKLPGTVIYSCGPEPMLKAVGLLASQAKAPCQLSLEAHMGCGFGVCLGCVVKNREGRYIRVCKEGPVFEADTLQDYSEEVAS